MIVEFKTRRVLPDFDVDENLQRKMAEKIEKQINIRTKAMLDSVSVKRDIANDFFDCRPKMKAFSPVVIIDPRSAKRRLEIHLQYI